MKKLFTLLAALMLAALALVACGQESSECKHTETVPNPDGPNAVEATCFQEGLSAEMICKDCKAVVEKSKTLPMTDHPAGDLPCLRRFRLRHVHPRCTGIWQPADSSNHAFLQY